MPTEMFHMRDGSVSFDPRLGRLKHFDERSRSFAIRELVANKKPRNRTWKCGPVLDQGRRPICVGAAWAGELAATPVVVRIDEEKTPAEIYTLAQKLDEWEGENYNGTSVLGGAKAVKQLGFIREYRWAFGMDDLILALSHAGPVVLGTNWYEGMKITLASGRIVPTGRIIGGHATLAYGVDISNERILVRNSWGPYWGDSGNCWLSFADMERLLAEDGEACIPIKRVRTIKRS